MSHLHNVLNFIADLDLKNEGAKAGAREQLSAMAAQGWIKKMAFGGAVALALSTVPQARAADLFSVLQSAGNVSGAVRVLTDPHLSTSDRAVYAGTLLAGELQRQAQQARIEQERKRLQEELQRQQQSVSTQQQTLNQTRAGDTSPNAALRQEVQSLEEKAELEARRTAALARLASLGVKPSEVRPQKVTPELTR